MEAKVNDVLDEVSRTMLDDGMELRLESITNGVASVHLVIDPETCKDCVVPKEMIERILLGRLRESAPSLHTVRLIEAN
jgi:hypothetical protein